MTLTETQVKALTDSELNALYPLVQAEWTLRREAAISEQRINDAVTAVHTAGDAAEGDPWVQPASLASGYPWGWRVTHAGSDWVSTTPANLTEPGTTGAKWSEVVGAHPAWSSQQPYNQGDLVTHNGSVWVALRYSMGLTPGTIAASNAWAYVEEEVTP